MAVELFAGAFVSASLEVLIDRLACSDVLNYLRGKKLSNELINNLKTVLIAVNALLDDAEEKQITNQNVKQWLDELEGASYHADDLLDEIATHASQSKLEASGSKKSKTSKLFKFSFSNSVHSYNRDMKNKLAEILERLEFLEKRRYVLSLTDKGAGEKPAPRQPTTSLIEESEVFGRDGDKEAIIKLLLTDDDHEGSNKKLSVIPIVGMGGVGKTTLAQLLYNDDRVKEHFELKSWVYVSEEFDVCKVTKTILEKVTESSQSFDNNDLDSLQTMLKKFLTGKKFLVVLDDVWNDNYGHWEEMSKPFKHGAKGSKLIVTSRHKSVADIMSTVSTPYRLEQLKDEDCWQLFKDHAFDNVRDSSVRQVLEPIGREIVKKCNGLPLAAKTLGGLLRSKEDVGEWERISKSEIWDLSSEQSNILPSLMLSYLHLPSYLKPCFAFCAIFRKGYKFSKQNLVLFWMAENLLHQTKTTKRMEDLGDEYFDKFVSMSFFQRSSAGGYGFVMHDIVHDLAKYVCGECCFALEDGDSDSGKDLSQKVRHLAVHPVVPSGRLYPISKPIGLRTFLVLYCFDKECLISNEAVNEVIEKFRCLRVLSLSRCINLNRLHESVGNLKHLRYLDLSYTEIIGLPESVSKLFNLQTLNLFECCKLIELPENMHHLINLRRLDIRECSELKKMPKHINKLKSLQSLTTFIVGKDGGAKIGELKGLPNLHGELSLENLQNVESAEDASEAKLMEKQYLEELKLGWGGDTHDSKRDEHVLEKLQPHTKLKQLYISGYGGTTFPNWLGEGSFCNILSLELVDCKFCTCLPPIGQLPCLRSLKISGLEGIVSVGAEFYWKNGGRCMGKAFASLEVLRFDEMSNWEKWCTICVEDGEVFPKLQQLKITNCGRLSTIDLSHNLPSLTKLRIYNVVSSLSLPRTPVLRELKLGSTIENLKLQELPQTLQSMAIGYYSTLFLNSIQIRDCEKLEFPMHQSLRRSSIQEVTILKSCGSLESFPLDFFLNLTRLTIKWSKNLESLKYLISSENIDETPLSVLKIINCPNFKCFPSGGLHAPNLSLLAVVGCEKLKKLPERMCDQLPSLKELLIVDCPELESFPEGGLPSNLTHLRIANCSKLFEHRMEWNLHTLQALTHFEIQDKCGVFVESFPEEGLLPSSLSFLMIAEMARLKKLPEQMCDLLPSLEELLIDDCPELESFPEGGLPSNLTHLRIANCSKLFEHRKEWNLHTLQALTHFEIQDRYGVFVESFPEEGLLPSSLSCLTISEMARLKNLDINVVRLLTSLQDLKICMQLCPQLQKLPDQALPHRIKVDYNYLYFQLCAEDAKTIYYVDVDADECCGM